MWMFAYAAGSGYKSTYLICNVNHPQLQAIIASGIPADATPTLVEVSGNLKKLLPADLGYTAPPYDDQPPTIRYIVITAVTKK